MISKPEWLIRPKWCPKSDMTLRACRKDRCRAWSSDKGSINGRTLRRRSTSDIVPNRSISWHSGYSTWQYTCFRNAERRRNTRRMVNGTQNQIPEWSWWITFIRLMRAVFSEAISYHCNLWLLKRCRRTGTSGSSVVLSWVLYWTVWFRCWKWNVGTSGLSWEHWSLDYNSIPKNFQNLEQPRK